MNIAQIAELAGVSSAAVSRYFNNGYISEEKREAIRQVVEKTGYRPSIQAQTLRTRKSMIIGVLAPKMASSSVGRMVDGILSVLNGSGYHTMLAVTQNDPEKEVEYLAALDEGAADGIILIGTIMTPAHRAQLKKMKVPVVVLGQQVQVTNCVYHDDYHAFYDMTEQFLSRGRDRLGYIGVLKQDHAVGEERARGFADALRDNGYAKLSENTVIADFTVESGRIKAEELMKRCPDLNGILCATDNIAAGAVQYLLAAGLRVPEDVLVSGQGDSEIMKAQGHGMLSIHYAYEKCGEIGARMMLQKLSGKGCLEKEVKLGYKLVLPSRNVIKLS